MTDDTISKHSGAATLRSEHRTHSLRSFGARLMRGENLQRDEAAQFINAMLDDAATDAQIAGALVSLAIKGETADELAGMAGVMRSLALRIKCEHSKFIDTAGTGSSRAKTFNVSTAAAFVVAGAGLPVAKHGGRAATSRSGSADALTSLGVNVATPPEVSQRCLNKIGICFMFAPLYHGATARVAAIRRELGVPTSFNLLGPLTNPAGAPFQIIGVWRHTLVKPMAQALLALGTKRAWVVHGVDGLDELTTAGPTFVAEACEGTIKEFEIKPADFGLEPISVTSLPRGDAEVSATLIREILGGVRHDEARDLVVINAAAALFVGGAASTLLDAGRMAKESIDSAAALRKLNDLAKATNE
ncbi:MAG TPA: anthranilate phosphoribosyltransferase [Pyrinomonadaceae bacterium]|nr:anthranilate phosphoribosyltransferase [Pyrinomonadaceae bacterium]